MSVPSSITADIQDRETTMRGVIDDALTAVNSTLNILGIIINPQQIVAGQSTNAAGATAPDMTTKKPDKPVLYDPAITPASKYASGFVMPDAGTISDNSVASSETFNFVEPVYTEWIMPELRTKLIEGFDSFSMTVAMEESIWARNTDRFLTALTDAKSRRATRWTGRGWNIPTDDLAARDNEVMANFSYVSADAARDRNIKTAEMKDDSRKFAIQEAFKGEQITIGRYEDVATRSLDAAEQTIRLAVEAFKQNIGKYTDVTVAQYMNELYQFVENLKVKVAQSKADVSRYITNTRLISERNRTTVESFTADAEALASDSYFNEAKAEVILEYNNLAIAELEENLTLQVEAIRANLNSFIKKANIEQGFTKDLGVVFAQYLSAALHSINVLMDAATIDYKEVTAT